MVTLQEDLDKLSQWHIKSQINAYKAMPNQLPLEKWKNCRSTWKWYSKPSSVTQIQMAAAKTKSWNV